MASLSCWLTSPWPAGLGSLEKPVNHGQPTRQACWEWQRQGMRVPPLLRQATGPGARRRGIHMTATSSGSLAVDGGDEPGPSDGDALKLDLKLGRSKLPEAKKKRRAGIAYATSAAVNVEDSQNAVVVPGRHQNSRVAHGAGAWMDAFVRFSRPHTILGTSISVLSVSLLAVSSLVDLNLRTFWGVFQALVPALCMNVAIVGLNQVYDVEIDKINKPYLPLASGEFSRRTGVGLSVGFAALGLAIGAAVGSPPLMATLAGSLALGVIYSIDLPLLRWKQYPVLAAGCILAVRAVLVQLGFYLHMQTSVFRRPSVLSRPVLFGVGFMCLFSIVIALFKDIPDVEGDRRFGLKSFSVQLGQKKIFNVCLATLLTAYAGAIGVGSVSQVLWSRVFTVVSHAAIASVLWRKAKQVDLSSKAAIYAFYMFVWKLFYMEYLLLPFIR